MDHQCNHDFSADRFPKRIFDVDLASLAPFSRRVRREVGGHISGLIVKGMSKLYDDLTAFNVDTLSHLLASYASHDRKLARHRLLALLDFTPTDGRLVLFLEPYPTATLGTLLQERCSLAEHLRGVPESEAVPIWASVVAAVTFLHLPAINISHMGIHGGTVLLYNIGGSGVHKWLVKLTEPMQSILATANSRHDLRNYKRYYPGELEYLAPETLTQFLELAKPILCSDRKNADIWSLGVLLYVSLHGRFPFQTAKRDVIHATFSEQLRNVSTEALPCTATTNGILINLLQITLQVNQGKRPSAVTILQLLEDYDWKQACVLQECHPPTASGNAWERSSGTPVYREAISVLVNSTTPQREAALPANLQALLARHWLFHA